MEKTLSITSARTQLLKLTKQVFRRRMDRYVLTNKGVAEAVRAECRGIQVAAEQRRSWSPIRTCFAADVRRDSNRSAAGQGVQLEAGVPR